MPRNQFRLHEILVEGFKGFTKAQSIPLGGKHLFVLGRNGYGKSSVIEAARWNLFGSTSRPGEMVLNQWYAGACRVETKLETGTKLLTLKRTLSRGTGGGTDPKLSDESGTELSMRQTLPELTSVNAGEGMHVVYSAQFARLHHAVENLKPFARTLYSYLGLSNVPVLQQHLKEFLKIHEDEETRLAQQLGLSQSSAETAIAAIEDQIGNFLALPPWGNQRVPTVTETRERVADFIQELAGLLPSYQPPDLAERAEVLIGHAESLVEQVTSTKVGEVENELGKAIRTLQARQTLATRAFAVVARIEQNRIAGLADTELRTTLLAGATPQSLADQVDGANRAATDSTLRLEIKSRGLEWTKPHRESSNPVPCPLCAQDTSPGGLANRLPSEIAEFSNEEQRSIRDRASLQDRLEHLSETETRLANLAKENGELDREFQAVRADTERLFQPPHSVEDVSATLTRLVNKWRAAVDSLEKRRADVSSSNLDFQARLNLLREEVRFHRLQEQERILKNRLSQCDRAQAALSEFAAFGENVRKVQGALDTSLVERLKSSLPTVNDKLSQAFQALTQHPVFDRVIVGEENLLELQLRVAASDEPSHLLAPEDVLNGQALSALELVPYFAFAELTEAPIEVHLLLLDDPTQAFDPEHIANLISKLADLGHHVQLVVATHETEKFQETIAKAFEPGSYSIVRFEGFDRKKGPAIAHVGT